MYYIERLTHRWPDLSERLTPGLRELDRCTAVAFGGGDKIHGGIDAISNVSFLGLVQRAHGLSLHVCIYLSLKFLFLVPTFYGRRWVLTPEVDLGS
jgi:hypothetical protein